MITAENASTMLNIIVSKKLVKNELPVRKVEHVVTSDKSNSKIFKTVLKRRSESMPEISRSRSSGSTLAIEDCTTYYKNGQEISEIINYTRKKMSLSLVDLHCESNDTGNCSSHTSLRCNLKATGKHYKKKCTMEGRRFESINVTKNNVTDDDDSKYAARLTVKKGLYKKQQHTFSEDTDLMLLASPGVEGRVEKQSFIIAY